MKGKAKKKKNSYKKKENTGDAAFGKYLEQKIKDSKYETYQDFAVAADCSEDYLKDVREGRTNPTLNMLKNFAKALDINKKDMLDYPDEEDNGNKENQNDGI